MARKSDRRKGNAARRTDGGAKAGAAGRKSVAKAAPAPPPAPPPAPKVKFRGKVLENEPLGRYTTWRLGGPARYLVLPADVEDVVKALEMARERGLPWVALGLGSNVLVKDGGFPGVVIRLGKGLDRFEMKGATAIVGGGMPTPILARRTGEVEGAAGQAAPLAQGGNAFRSAVLRLDLQESGRREVRRHVDRRMRAQG